ncbi:MAG: flagellar hook-basal body complex protein [Oceanospirillales bacterium]|uniref:Flagellar hook protein FlgE n=1 Tax=Marinobacterium halophilum TaxID=267374 RepID=A0A2P8ESB4_9GAMM|nr:flagellar hook-basal body complex protein [Marinobacterium halophilum]MBR9827669.1 flagellar hook-basal body complex protein [Oceanospirillales bacterium]PSL12334.1 flagellar hook protein FlgE [Marinobacterium halophilum]
MAGFSTAVTGLKASTTMLDVAGNNIANSSTVGFKSSRTEFGDIYATAVVGAGSANVAGSGVTVTDIAQDFKAGTIEFTNNNLDLAINGSGFFQLDDGQGGVTYTRAGAFELNKDGYIVSKNGKFLQGYGLDADGNRLPIGNMAVTEKESPPKATENIDLSFNIDARDDASKLLQSYDKDEPGSFTYTTTMRTFDSLGNEHTIKFNLREQSPERNVYGFDNTATTLSGVDITGAPLPGDPAIDPNNLPQWAVDLADADPRIDVTSVRYDPAVAPPGAALTFELKAWATDSGDVVVTDGTNSVPNLLTGPDNYRAANEVWSYDIGSVTAPASGVITIGGVEIDIENAGDAGVIGRRIAEFEPQILEANPNIESVQLDTNSTPPSIKVTFKAIEGDVNNTDLDLVQVNDLTGFDFGGAAAGAGPQTVDPAVIAQGDNSYQGYYRTYAYLNGEEQLDLGKLTDPGEAKGTEPGPILLSFNPTNGLLRGVNIQEDGDFFSAGSAVPSITISGADPANPGTKIELDMSGTTQFASSSIVKSQLQDGYTKGDLIGVTFAGTGEMIASFSNGQNQALGVVAIASFENQSGLQPNGDTEWSATLTSGDAVMNPPGTGLNGTLRSAALESSNVDLSAELVKLIEGQRNFQANSKTLETLNAVTQSILQI